MYNPSILELFSNWIWVVITATLFASWLLVVRRRRPDSPLPGIALQLTALILLAAVLLPVISLSDDLQACNTPAEVELLSRRAEPHSSPDQPLPGVHIAFAVLTSLVRVPHLVPVGTHTPQEPAPPEMRGFAISAATRPPPAV